MVTLLLGLFYKVEAGMLAGTFVHLGMLIFRASKPRLSVRDCQVEGDGAKYLLLTPDRGLFFPSVEDIRDAMNEASSARKERIRRESVVAAAKGDEMSVAMPEVEPLPVIIDMSRVVDMDYTAAAVSLLDIVVLFQLI